MEKIGVTQAMLLASIQALAGVFILIFFVNTASALVSLLSLVLYAFAYTPLKRYTPVCSVGGSHSRGIASPNWMGLRQLVKSPYLELSFFSIQFLWQFPHFWSIAWVLNDDYNKAGFHLLPSPSGKSKKSAFHLFFYSLFLLPIAVVPLKAGMTGIWGTGALLAGGLLMVYFAFELLKTSSNSSAKKLMFSSFVYLPLVQIFLMLDQI